MMGKRFDGPWILPITPGAQECFDGQQKGQGRSGARPLSFDVTAIVLLDKKPAELSVNHTNELL
jgi:hypothetical protein